MALSQLLVWKRLLSSTNESFDKQNHIHIPSIKFCLVEIMKKSPSKIKDDYRVCKLWCVCVRAYKSTLLCAHGCTFAQLHVESLWTSAKQSFCLQSFVAALPSGVNEDSCFELHPLTLGCRAINLLRWGQLYPFCFCDNTMAVKVFSLGKWQSMTVATLLRQRKVSRHQIYQKYW